MAQTTVPIPPYQVPIVDKNGRLTQDWIIWIREIYRYLNQALSEADSSAQGRDL